jgi:hypothetical protein
MVRLVVPDRLSGRFLGAVRLQKLLSPSTRREALSTLLVRFKRIISLVGSASFVLELAHSFEITQACEDKAL